MSQSLKVAVSGSHSTDKSSFLRLVKQHLDTRNIQHTIVADMATRCPFPILKQQTIESSLWMISTSVAEEIAALNKTDIVLVDRPIIDTWAYLMAVTSYDLSSDSNAALATYECIIQNWIRTYDIIYRTQIDETIPVEDNKGRDLDASYRSLIGSLMDSAYIKFEVSTRLLNALNVQQEVDWLVNYIVKEGVDRDRP